jgi:Trk K+ transport system NAD-binding subunit
VIVAIERDNDDSIVIPTGDTQLRVGDRIVAVVKNGAAEKLQAVFNAPAGSRA